MLYHFDRWPFFFINLNLHLMNFEMLELYAVSLSIHFIWGYNFVISELYEVWMCVYCLKCLISSHTVYGEEGDVNWFCCRWWESNPSDRESLQVEGGPIILIKCLGFYCVLLNISRLHKMLLLIMVYNLFHQKISLSFFVFR